MIQGSTCPAVDGTCVTDGNSRSAVSLSLSLHVLHLHLKQLPMCIA